MDTLEGSLPVSARRQRRHAWGAWSLIMTVLLAMSLLATGCDPWFGGGGANTARSTPTAGQATPTSAVQSQLARAVYLNTWGLGVGQLDTTYDAQNATVKVTITLTGTIPNTELKASAAQELTKAFCLMAHQALWTSGVHLSEVTVVVQGPMQDEYADTIINPYGIATIGSDAAQRVDWAGVSADDAWQQYDKVFLRGSFELVD